MERTDEIVKWYIDTRPKYKDLANKVESIIIEILRCSDVEFFSVTSRTKDIESFTKKAKKEKYSDPINQIKDMTGIRIITFFKSDVLKCCEIIKQLFNIDLQNSIDKGEDLGFDKMGYRSIHFIAELTEDRLKLPEYRGFKGMCFEIQIRTILEHAWADITHDRNYKFQGVLPDEIKRRFSLIAATLELSDREFDSIAKEISTYQQDVKESTESGNLHIELNTTSLKEYLDIKLDKYITADLIEPIFNGCEAEIIFELKRFHINKLSELDLIIDAHVEQAMGENDQNYSGLLRNVMIMQDIDLYFNSAWNKNWSGLSREDYNMFMRAGVNIKKYVDKYALIVD